MLCCMRIAPSSLRANTEPQRLCSTHLYSTAGKGIFHGGPCIGLTLHVQPFHKAAMSAWGKLASSCI